MRLKHVISCGIAVLVVASCALAGSMATGRRYYADTVFSWWPTAKDLSLFQKFVDESKEKGMNSISIDVPWSIMSADGRCDFAEADKRIDYIVSRGMSVFIRINTTTLGGQSPKWLTDDMLQRIPDGSVYRRSTDGATLPSLAHPAVLRRITSFCRSTAEHYGSRYRRTASGDYPVVALSPAFSLYMESGYFPDADVDYSTAAQADFAAWVKTYYKSLADLNAKWGRNYKSWREIKLADAHNTAKQLYFEFTLQRVLGSIADAVHKASNIPVGLQVGCIWDNPQRRTMSVGPLMRKMDWLFTADAPDFDHAFSTDYARCSALGKKVSSEIDAASHAAATNGRYFNQGVRAFEHGASSAVLANWDLSSIRDNDKWPFLHFLGELARKPSANPKPDKAIYVSTWDLINKTASIDQYLPVYEMLSDGGKQCVDVLSDYAISANPAILSNYSEIYLPANWTIPPEVRMALARVKNKLKASKPLIAGTLDEYGRPADPFIKP
ncbi:MAG: beta-galactosidase [Armatimonadota bacterium]